jgi:phage head maturation protease
MPRYYFHVRRGQMTVLDQEGIELAGTVDAEVEAAQRAQQMVNRGSLNGASMNGEFLSAQSASHGRIIVADDNWETLFEFPF